VVVQINEPLLERAKKRARDVSRALYAKTFCPNQGHQDLLATGSRSATTAEKTTLLTTDFTTTLWMLSLMA
jgi:hypothetical protein